MNDSGDCKNLTEKLESFLAQACEAESQSNLEKAERLFKLALYCEGRSRSDIAAAKQYADEAGPVYSKSVPASV